MLTLDSECGKLKVIVYAAKTVAVRGASVKRSLDETGLTSVFGLILGSGELNTLFVA